MIQSQDIKNDILSAFASRPDLTDALIYRYMTYAQKRVVRLRDWDELRATETLNGVYNNDSDDMFLNLPTPTTVRKILSLTLLDPNGTDEWKLTRVVSNRRWETIASDRMRTGRDQPVLYTKFARDKLELAPLPDQAYNYRMRLTRWPADITSANETDPPTIENAADIIMHLSCALIARRFGQEERAQDFFRDYAFAVKELGLEDATVHDAEQKSGAGLANRTAGQYWANPFVGSGEQV